jgi:hypothetical protein
MKKYVLVVFAVCFMVTGCKNSSTESINTALISDYFPFKMGNAWSYATSSVSITGSISSSDSATLSVVQTNTLVGGQPNAYVLKIASSTGKENNIACYSSDKTLYTYLGETSIVAVPNVLYWYGSVVNNATVAPGQSKIYAVLDSPGNHVSFSIKRTPVSSIATASVVNNDSLRIVGVVAGNTYLVLQKTGGTAKDTMVVLIEVENGGRAIAPPFASWMPVWQVAGSSEETMYAWDTLYSFRLRRDSTLCTDNINYAATCRLIGIESVTALGSTISTEKFITTISVTEVIRYRGELIFSGPSTEYTLTLWLRKGVGIVKATFNGNSLVAGVIVNGTYDSAGVLHGIFVSPRVTYGCFETASGDYGDYFTVNYQPLADTTSSSVAMLKTKNF